MVYVDAQDFPQQLIDVLGVVRYVVAAAAIARRHIQVAVWPEGYSAAVVVCLSRMRDREQGNLRRIRHIRVPRRDVILGELQHSIGVASVVNKKTSVILVV